MPRVSEKRPNVLVGRSPICAEKVFLIALWTMGTPESYRAIGDRFNVAKSSVYSCLNTVLAALNNNLCKICIRWPNDEEMVALARNFNKYSIPDAIGAVDGCHIPSKRPTINGSDYFNRKKLYSIVLQGICGPNLMFTDVDVRWPGSVHDARVFRTSDIFSVGMNFCELHYYILGDSAYPCLTWLLCPFRNNGHLTPDKILYNTKLSKSRVVIKNAFALLKGRFRRVRDMLDRDDVQSIAETIVACCVLHNICLMKEDDDIENFIQEGRVGHLQDICMARGNYNFNEHLGNVRRNELVRYLRNNL